MKTNKSIACTSARSGSRFLSLIKRACLLTVCALPGFFRPALADTCQPNHHSQNASFAVLSDLHVYDTQLGTAGSAFQAYLDADPKLLAYSESIFESALADIIKSRVNFVIISGDLTKDGEFTSHLRVVRHLQKLEQAGIQVFVVPGNHDINNHDAVSFAGDTTKPVPSVTAHLFKALYHRFGYGQAISNAPDSLSYVAEPVPGVWLLAIDSAKWADSATSEHPVVSGRITAQTMSWALAKIHEGQSRGKKVVAFMHHGVNLHFLSEPQLFPDYLVDNWPVVGAQFARAGLKVVFTGHYHSQDISNLTVDATGTPAPSSLFDIETGALASWPCAYRIAHLDRAGTLSIESRRVTEIKADLGGVPFQQYAQTFSQTRLPFQVSAELEQLFGLPEAQAKAVAPIVVDALMANYAGDENPSDETLAMIQDFLSYPSDTPYYMMGQILATLWLDPSQTDNAISISITN